MKKKKDNIPTITITVIVVLVSIVLIIGLINKLSEYTEPQPQQQKQDTGLTSAEAKRIIHIMASDETTPYEIIRVDRDGKYWNVMVATREDTVTFQVNAYTGNVDCVIYQGRKECKQ